MRSVSPEIDARRHAGLFLWLANVLAGTVIGTNYLAHVPEGVSTRTVVFLCLGLVSSVVTLALVPAGIFWLAERFVRSPALQGWIQAIAGSAFIGLLTADTVVYNLLGYHFNSAVWNVMITRGSGDAVVLGGKVWGTVFAGECAVAVAQFLLWRFFYRRRLHRGDRGRARRPLLRPVALFAAVFVGVVSIERTIYAAAELEGDLQLHSASQVLPGYQGLRVSQLLPDGMEGVRGNLPSVDFRAKGEPLAYPRQRPRVDPDGRRPNVLLLVLDTWRADHFTAETTPELWRFAEGARVFANHLSGGNGTRFGVFSMLYGLHGSYWFPVLEARRPPVLLDTLAELGYERVVFSSASQSFPEFRDTAWVDMLERVFDDYPAERSYERDELLAERFRAWLQDRYAREAEEPFFSFVLLDSPHQPYNSPPGGPFQPAAEKLDYIELARSSTPELIERVLNRYRNSLWHGDLVAGKLLSALEEVGELEDTLVLVTGDHGEEFQETGFWGHTSNFTDWQLAVPLYVKGPGIEPGIEERPTSHLDLAPTLLEWLGADPADRAGWTLGESLFDPSPVRDRVVAGWEHLGLVTADGIFRIRMGSRSPLDVELFDPGWRISLDPAEPYLRHADSLERLARECRRFLATP